MNSFSSVISSLLQIQQMHTLLNCKGFALQLHVLFYNYADFFKHKL